MWQAYVGMCLLPARDFHDYLRILMPLVYDFICCSNLSISYIYLRYLPLIFQFAWLSAYHLKEHTYTLHIPTWWLELAFSITQPNFMAASYSRKCLVSRQLLYFEEIKGFSFIYGNDILKNLKGWPSFTKGYAEYVYIFCFDRIFSVLERNIQLLSNKLTALQSCFREKKTLWYPNFNEDTTF